MDADAMVRAVVATLNAWADAEMDKLTAEHATLAALILPRLPAVLPTGQREHDDRRTLALMREKERLALQRVGSSARKPRRWPASSADRS